jgi:hypothetical protein
VGNNTLNLTYIKSDRFFSLWLRAKGFAADEQKKKGDRLEIEALLHTAIMEAMS